MSYRAEEVVNYYDPEPSLVSSLLYMLHIWLGGYKFVKDYCYCRWMGSCCFSYTSHHIIRFDSNIIIQDFWLRDKSSDWEHNVAPMICYYSQNTSDAECAGFSHQAILQLSTDTNSGCPTIEFNSDSNYLELVQTPPPG